MFLHNSFSCVISRLSLQRNCAFSTPKPYFSLCFRRAQALRCVLYFFQMVRCLQRCPVFQIQSLFRLLLVPTNHDAVGIGHDKNQR